MNEHPTNTKRSEKNQKVYSATKASSPQGMGAERQWGRSSPEVSDSSPHGLSMEEGHGARSESLLDRHKTQDRSPYQATGKGKPEAERGFGFANAGADAFKKRDELGLTTRPKGFSYTQEQRQGIIQEVQNLHAQELRPSPWKTPHYEPFRPNQIWGADWTIVIIMEKRHYLLSLIDYFSRSIVAWGIVKSVTQHKIQDLVTLAYINESIEQKQFKPLVRVDRGSPNMAGNTKKLIKDLEMVLSPARSHRPTDNGRKER
jgi:hypothetical protein